MNDGMRIALNYEARPERSDGACRGCVGYKNTGLCEALRAVADCKALCVIWVAPESVDRGAAEPAPGASVNADQTVAVDREYHWRPIDADTPRGVKLQLISEQDGVAVYAGVSSNREGTRWTHWAPLPTFKKEEK